MSVRNVRLILVRKNILKSVLFCKNGGKRNWSQAGRGRKTETFTGSKGARGRVREFSHFFHKLLVSYGFICIENLIQSINFI